MRISVRSIRSVFILVLVEIFHITVSFCFDFTLEESISYNVFPRRAMFGMFRLLPNFEYIFLSLIQFDNRNRGAKCHSSVNNRGVQTFQVRD